MDEQPAELSERVESALREGAAGHLRDVMTVEWDASPGAPVWWNPGAAVATAAAASGILCSTFFRQLVARASASGAEAVGALPMPAVDPQDAAQLAVLFDAHQSAGAAGRERLRGALDRCVADLFGLRLSLLIDFERSLDSETDMVGT